MCTSQASVDDKGDEENKIHWESVKSKTDLFINHNSSLSPFAGLLLNPLTLYVVWASNKADSQSFLLGWGWDWEPNRNSTTGG